MDHSNCQGWTEESNILSFTANLVTWGCGCNKKSIGGAPIVAARRVTVYEVQSDGVTVAEFNTLPEARAEAVKVAGRVKVSSKVVQ